MKKELILKFLWLEKSIAVCLDQKVGDSITPLTEFFFWPQKDAWEEMKNFLESQSWITQSDSVNLLNNITEVINFWQERDTNVIDRKHISNLREKFPDIIVIGQ
uniref:Small ribosomal subunit protein cS23 n=2 Tax=Euglena granulata TaxID=69255 RepID=RRP3_EUGGA|nr:RecName: Full=Small ribosomal subunit protein cS23; AltName: Full=30S ribosomal protein 3, chloroplastic; Short=PSRP-3 [Euglena granulata]AAK27689.1 ycf65 [Euglena granulata]ABB02344.1 Ycf65 [Euglena granulata]